MTSLLPPELETQALLKLHAGRRLAVLLQIACVVSLVAAVAALTVSLLSFQHEARTARAEVKYEITEQCSLYALVGELPPSLNPPTSKFAMGLVTDLRNKYTSLGCPGKLPASKVLIELDERYHLHLDS